MPWFTRLVLICMAVLLSQCTAEVSLQIDTPTPIIETTSTDTTSPTLLVTAHPNHTRTPHATATAIPSPTKIGSMLATLAPTKVSIDSGVVKPTEKPKMLRFVRQSLDEAATCVLFRIQGIDTTGWRVTIDGLKLASPFAADGTARICGLRAGAEITFTIRDATDTAVAGGAGIPARDTAVMVATWE